MLFGLGKADTDIVLNTLINNKWGAEQRCANHSLAMDKPFSIRILVLVDYFKVAVNGRHLCDFIHRIPWQEIKLIYIGGCCRLDVVEYQGSLDDGTPSTPMPFPGPVDNKGEPIVVTKPVSFLIFFLQPVKLQATGSHCRSFLSYKPFHTVGSLLHERFSLSSRRA